MSDTERTPNILDAALALVQDVQKNDPAITSAIQTVLVSARAHVTPVVLGECCAEAQESDAVGWCDDLGAIIPGECEDTSITFCPFCGARVRRDEVPLCSRCQCPRSEHGLYGVPCLTCSCAGFVPAGAVLAL